MMPHIPERPSGLPIPGVIDILFCDVEPYILARSTIDRLVGLMDVSLFPTDSIGRLEWAPPKFRDLGAYFGQVVSLCPDNFYEPGYLPKAGEMAHNGQIGYLWIDKPGNVVIARCLPVVIRGTPNLAIGEQDDVAKRIRDLATIHEHERLSGIIGLKAYVAPSSETM